MEIYWFIITVCNFVFSFLRSNNSYLICTLNLVLQISEHEKIIC